MDESRVRGDRLLRPLGIAVEDVQTITLSRKKFENAATAKQFVRLHGMGNPHMISTQTHFVFEVAKDSDFEADTFRDERVNHDIDIRAGVRKDLDIHIEVEEPIAKVTEEVVEEVTDLEIEVAPVAKVGELFPICKQDDAATDSVRTVGIVLKPEEADIQGSIISEEEIEKANLEFMKDYGTVGLMHQKSVDGRVFIIQNVIAPTDILFPQSDGTTKKVTKGTWYQEHYTEDEEIVQKIRNGELTGLSIGGFAKHVPIERKAIDVNAISIEKSEGGELKRVNKGKPDHRLVDLSVQEVSLVDVAANEERFLVVKRLDPNEAVEAADAQEAKMNKQEERKEAASAPAEESKVEAIAPVTAMEPEAQAVVKGEETKLEVDVAALVTEAVAKAVAGLNAKLEGVEKQLSEQAEQVQKSATVVAAAKGESTPAETEMVQKNEEPKNVWAGTAIRRVAQRSVR